MAVTDDVVGVVIPLELVVPDKSAGVGLGKAGTLYLSGGKLHFNPSDGGTPEVVTSA